MEKADEVLEMLKGLLATQITASNDVDDEDEEHLPTWALNALLEAITIIAEKCDTKEEQLLALERIQAAIHL